jgi:hypothetical protein
MRYSYSRIECWKNCPYQYKLRYIDKLQTLPEQNADNPLYLGTAIHTAFETGKVEDAIKSYRSNYRVITDANITEEIKLEYLIPKVLELLPEAECEVEIKTNDFIGYIDRLVYLFTDEQGIKHYEIWDYKYSNNVNHYLESGQLHIYKYHFELTHPNCVVDHLRYVFIPKINIRQKLKAKPPETIIEFRNRVREHLEAAEIKIVEIDYDSNRIQEFKDDCKRNACSTTFPKNQTRLCDWCAYKKYCESNGQEDWMIINNIGEENMNLPENKKRELKKEKLTQLPDLFIYGASYVGKSTFYDSLDNVLFINTDGNCDMYQNPSIYIGKTVQMNGRMKIEKSAWQNFLDVIEELEKKENTFKYIALDLVEDLREHCRVHMCDKLKIAHESDSNYSKGWDMVTTEYNQAIKRIKAAGYTVLYVSKEVTKDVTPKGGTPYTTYNPNLPEKTANMLAGTVKLTCRISVDEKGERWLNLKPNVHEFGGGRYNFKVDKCKLSVAELLKAINEADTK